MSRFFKEKKSLKTQFLFSLFVGDIRQIVELSHISLVFEDGVTPYVHGCGYI